MKIKRYLVLLGLLTGMADTADDALSAAPDELRRQLAAMNPAAQCDWFAQGIGKPALLKASDAQLLAVLQALESSALFCPVKRMTEQHPEYEFLMLRRERLAEGDDLPEKPERMLVKYRSEPRTIYALGRRVARGRGKRCCTTPARTAKKCWPTLVACLAWCR